MIKISDKVHYDNDATHKEIQFLYHTVFNNNQNYE